MQITNISDAKASLSQLIKIVQETNEPIIIGKAGHPVVILSAFKENSSPRKLEGNWEGKVKIMDDFDELSDGFYSSAGCNKRLSKAGKAVKILFEQPDKSCEKLVIFKTQ